MVCKKASLSFLCVVSIISVFALIFMVSIPSASAISVKPQCVSYCGNGKIDIGELCEPPNSVNNINCCQSTEKCLNGKFGTRDSYGNCNSQCGCNYDPFVYSCVQGKCDAQCDSNDDCNDSNPNTVDTCLGNCTCKHEQQPYCGDGTVKPPEQCELPNTSNNPSCSESTSECKDGKLGTRPSFGNCNSTCGCTHLTFTYSCVKDMCGAVCSQDSDCNDGNPNTADTCLDNCSCQHIPQPYCGDGIVNLQEQCELPNTLNNNYCNQTTTSGCQGYKLGTRDAFGNCDSECGCVDDPFVYSCVKGACGATCSGNPDCQPYCSGNFRYYNGVCRTCDSCQCAYSYENCDSRDGWYNATEYRWVSIGQCTEKQQVKKEYRDYSCAPQACQYVSKNVVWEDTGQTRNKVDGTSCDDGLFCTSPDTCTGGVCGGPSRDCSQFNFSMIATCDNNPDSNPFTWDSSPGFTSICDEEHDMCTTGEQEIQHECSIENCSAQCEKDSDCPDSQCSETFNDYCNGLMLVDYNSNMINDSVQVNNSIPNTCLLGCTCTNNKVECNPPEPQSYCVKGECGAECVSNEDCNDGDPNTVDSCLGDCTCKHEYVPSCGNGIVDNPPEQCELPDTTDNENCIQSTSECLNGTFKVAFRDQYGDCNSQCGCIEDPLEYKCVKDQCGAQCDKDSDCNDGNPDTIDTCLGDCTCHHEVYVPFCGNGIVDPNEMCELNGTFNNIYCNQTIHSECQGFKIGVRDAFGNCDGECGCTYDPFVYMCVKGECGATCSDNSDCQPYCSGDFRYYNGVCRTCSTCQCAYSYENCNSKDGWYTTTEFQWVPTGECTEKEQVKKEYRDYSCAPEACTYTVTKSVWEDTGQTRDKEDGTLCGLPRECSSDQCIGPNWTIFPSSGHDSCSAGVCQAYSCEALSSQFNQSCQPQQNDSDSDGVPDPQDACPGEFGQDCNGCPDPCTGCAKMVCSSGPPTYEADDSQCLPTQCPADGCGLGGCAQDELADYPVSIPNTCSIEGNSGVCADNGCISTCTASELCLPWADHVVFSEVMYDAPASENDKEWLELYNPTNSDVNLGGYDIFVKSSFWTIPQGVVIKADSYLTIARNATAFYQVYGCYPDVDKFTKSFTNDGSNLTLKNGIQEIDMIAYLGFIAGWDLWSDENKTISRSPAWLDTDSPSDWLNNTDPTPWCIKDADGDGYNNTVDCNDSDPSIHPGATDICGNNIDEDCNGLDAVCLQTLAVASFSGGGGGGGCFSSWSCTDFSECQPAGTQARTCTDNNECGTAFGKPSETQNCTYTLPAKAEEQAVPCSPGSRKCDGDYITECISGDDWVKVQMCEFGCSNGACLEGAASDKKQVLAAFGGVPVLGLFLLDPSAWPYWILIAFAIILIVWYLMHKRKKMKGSAAFRYQWKRN